MDQEKDTERTDQGVPIVESKPLRGIDRITANYMMKSHQEYAAITGMVELDFSNFVAYREKILADLGDAGTRISLSHMMIKTLALALKDHPIFNATLVENEVKFLGEINIGIAVAMENGQLVVPVIHKADILSLQEIAQEASRLSEKVRAGRVDIDDVAGGTCTFSNFGMFGGDIATPLINPPQSSILALGRIVPKPVVVYDAITIRKMGWISVTVDHRIINGVQAAMFSRTLEKYISAPEKLVIN